ncbi:MAG TPA: serpin family protein, partial [Actinomycetota bacterium]|nr:serpin family protein [Actinomycetota bacterium]
PRDVAGTEVQRAPAAGARPATVVEGVNAFGLDLLALLSGESDANLVFSPFSIAMAFGMADAGARGDTAAEIEETFGFPPGRSVHAGFDALVQELARPMSPTLRVANRMYPAVGLDLEAAFVETLAERYGAPTERLDFVDESEEARRRINAWVAERTEDRIPELLGGGAVTPETRLVLVNALYLEAKWARGFGEYPTEDAPFTRLDGSTVDAPLMEEAALETSYFAGDGVTAVEIPYEDEELSMLVVLPDDPAGFELDAPLLEAIDRGAAEGTVQLFLPRWSTDSNVDLVETLPRLGLATPFGPDADFGGISPDAPPIGAAVHAANIDVDEEGTVAAAATAVAFATSGPPPPDAVVRADRPFVYLIRDRATGVVLFAGRVTDPLS